MFSHPNFLVYFHVFTPPKNVQTWITIKPLPDPILSKKVAYYTNNSYPKCNNVVMLKWIPTFLLITRILAYQHTMDLFYQYTQLILAYQYTMYLFYQYTQLQLHEGKMLSRSNDCWLLSVVMDIQDEYKFSNI